MSHPEPRDRRSFEEKREDMLACAADHILHSGPHTLSEMARDLECAPGGGQFGRFELTIPAGLPEDGSHDETPITQRSF